MTTKFRKGLEDLFNEYSSFMTPRGVENDGSSIQQKQTKAADGGEAGEGTCQVTWDKDSMLERAGTRMEDDNINQSLHGEQTPSVPASSTDPRKHGTAALIGHMSSCQEKKKLNTNNNDNRQKELVFGADLEGSLDTAQKYEKAFDCYEDANSFFKSEMMSADGLLEKDDWLNVRRLYNFLSKFYEMTMKISGFKHVTSNLFLDDICDVYFTLTAWDADPNFEMHSMAKKMKDKFEKYWGNIDKINYLFFFFACMLDLRKKVEYVRFCFVEMFGEKEAENMTTKVRKGLEDLFNEYSSFMIPRGVENDGSSIQQKQTKAADGGEAGEGTCQVTWDKFKKFRKDMGKEDHKTQLEKFLSEDDETDDDIDVLMWWKVNSLRCPILASISRDILVVLISTVASESAFSTGGRVFDSYQSSLTPKIIQALVCSQD
ncbi:hypothetical protein PTKIN_Ptkin19aG0037700 [Pterospermum kingtungense]